MGDISFINDPEKWLRAGLGEMRAEVEAQRHKVVAVILDLRGTYAVTSRQSGEQASRRCRHLLERLSVCNSALSRFDTVNLAVDVLLGEPRLRPELYENRIHELAGYLHAAKTELEAAQNVLDATKP